MKRTLAVIVPFGEIAYVEVDEQPGVDMAHAALDEALDRGLIDEHTADVAVCDADRLVVYSRQWVSTRTVAEAKKPLPKAIEVEVIFRKDTAFQPPAEKTFRIDLDRVVEDAAIVPFAGGPISQIRIREATEGDT